MTLFQLHGCQHCCWLELLLMSRRKTLVQGDTANFVALEIQAVPIRPVIFCDHMSEIVCLLVVLASYLVGIFYFAMLVTDADWHSVPTMWHCPFYISFVIALVCHAVTVGWLLAARASSFVVMASCVALVALSMAWLPLARRGATNAISKWWTRVVLFASTAPLFVLSVLAWLESDDAGAVSTYPVIHALILNAGVYGFYFV